MRMCFPFLPLDLDRPRFFQHEGSPALTLSLHRRTVPAPLRIPGPLTDGRKAEEKEGRLTIRKQRTNKVLRVGKSSENRNNDTVKDQELLRPTGADLVMVKWLTSPPFAYSMTKHRRSYVWKEYFSPYRQKKNNAQSRT